MRTSTKLAITLTLMLTLPALAVLPSADGARLATLPQGNWNNAAWVDGVAYMIGGYDWNRPAGPGRAMQEVLRYDPATNEATIMDATLPYGRWWLATASDGAHVYGFGGNAWSFLTDEIFRYDPATDTLETLATRLPYRMQAAGAAFDGTHIYVLGGDGAGGTILRFDPATHEIVTMGARLPEDFWFDPISTWNGTHVALVARSAVGVYDPAADVFTHMPRALPEEHYGTPLVADDDKLFVLGAGKFHGGAVYNLTSGHYAMLESHVDAWPDGGARWDGDAILYTSNGCMGTCNAAYRHVPVEPAEPPTLHITRVDAGQHQEEDGSYHTYYYVGGEVANSSLYDRELRIVGAGTEASLLNLLGEGTEWSAAGGWGALRPGDFAWDRFSIHGDPAPTMSYCVQMRAQTASSEWGWIESNVLCNTDSLLGDLPIRDPFSG